MAWSSERVAAKLEEERMMLDAELGVTVTITPKTHRVHVVTTVERRRSINILLYSLKKGKVTE